MDEEEVQGVVIVGGGICGLATALALHRKGISSLVLEKSGSLRATGAAIGLWSNAWRVLDRLGVADELRNKSCPLTEVREQSVQNKSTAAIPLSGGEFRCVTRKDLVEALAAGLPPAAIRFGCRIDRITTDPFTSCATLHTSDGRSIKAKVLIGCDGSNSAVARFLGLKPATAFPLWVIRGFTTYPDGHPLGTSLIRLSFKDCIFGMIPIDDRLVHFFITIQSGSISIDSEIRERTELIRELALQRAQDLPPELAEVVKRLDMDSLSLTKAWYRAPWHLLRPGKFQRGTVTVAGDAMHVMGPFLGQGGASGMEDAIVLARRIAQAMASGDEGRQLAEKIGAAQRMYVQERWARVMWLSSCSYVRGSVISAASTVKRLIFIAIVVVFFGGFGNVSHSRFDCGAL